MVTSVTFEPYRASHFHTMPALDHFKSDPEFKSIVGRRTEVAVTLGTAALMCDLNGDVLMFVSIFEDGLMFRSKMTSVFNCQMFGLPHRYLLKNKSNLELYAQRPK